LKYLNLLSCVSDLGTSLGNLNVLWLSRCGLIELDGISALPNLVEAYLSFNNIEDISALSCLEHLQILDLEGYVIDFTCS
jgi:Leucine-rich repeat (LRR) protein